MLNKFAPTCTLCLASLLPVLASPGRAADSVVSARGDLVEVTAQLGFASGEPIGLEIIDWPTLLDRDVAVDWSRDEPVADALRRGLKPDGVLQVERLKGVTLIRSSNSRDNALDAVIPEFKVRRASILSLGSALQMWLEAALNPDPTRGYAGRTRASDVAGMVGPLEIWGATVRTILSILVAATPEHGLWLADGSVLQTYERAYPLWIVVSYNEGDGVATSALQAFTQRRAELYAARMQAP